MPSSRRSVLPLALTAAALVGPAVWATAPAADTGRVPAIERAAVVETDVADDAAVVATADGSDVRSVAPITTPSTTTTTARPTTTTTPAAAAAHPGRDRECESSMHAWIDQSRTEHGLTPLRHDPGIQHVALEWSQAMADRSDLAHSPHYGDRIFAARPRAQTAGENVGRSEVSARAIHDEFLRSYPHRTTILGREFSHVAVGCLRDADDELWVTVHFWG